MLCLATGVTAEFLSLVSQLPALQSLDMTNQWLLGTLPANLSFPRLTELRLTYNDISVGPACDLARSKMLPCPWCRIRFLQSFGTNNSLSNVTIAATMGLGVLQQQFLCQPLYSAHLGTFPTVPKLKNES